MKEVRVFAPASVANVAVGFDALGFAIDRPGDEIIARRMDRPGVHIAQITGTGDKQLPTDPSKNTAGVAVLRLWEAIPDPGFGVELEIHKRMPFGSGLGSSAASAAGAVVAANALLDQPLSRHTLLPYAVAGEQAADGAYHADNVAPSLIGGMLLIRDNHTLDLHQLPCPKELYASVVHPKVEVLTKEARTILKPTVQLKAAIEQAANMGAFVTALFKEDYDLLSRCLQDTLIEPQRAQLIPHFRAVRAAAIQSGALGCSISGAGPSVFALSRGAATAERVGEAMQNAFLRGTIPASLFVSEINQRGVEILQQDE